jgi:hypothetical protein
MILFSIEIIELYGVASIVLRNILNAEGLGLYFNISQALTLLI